MLTWIKNGKPIEPQECNHRAYPAIAIRDFDILNGFTIITVSCLGCGKSLLKTITRTEKGLKQK